MATYKVLMESGTNKLIERINTMYDRIDAQDAKIKELETKIPVIEEYIPSIPLSIDYKGPLNEIKNITSDTTIESEMAHGSQFTLTITGEAPFKVDDVEISGNVYTAFVGAQTYKISDASGTTINITIGKLLSGDGSTD